MSAIRSYLNGLSLGGSNQTLFFMIAAVIVALLIVAIVYLVSMTTPQGRLDALLDERASRTRRSPASRWTLRLVGVILLLAAVAMTSNYLGEPSQCARCHGDSPQQIALAESAHAGVDCMSCHRKTGFTGPARTALTYARWVYTYAAVDERPDPVAGSVEDAACLSCHGYVTTETTERKGVRVRHSDFLELGSRCRDCHNSTAHPNAVQEPSSPEMADCIVCHDGETVSADCEVCHPGDPLQYTASGEDLPKVQDLDTSNCYGCHDEYAECLFCHGQTMPHPPGWGPEDAPPGLPGDHANAGFVDRDSCYRCHYSPGGIFEFSADNCEPCHETPGRMHGGEPWVAEHGLQATGQKGGELSDCYTCHGSSGFCAGCHPASYAELYSPIGGADNYPRDLPKPPAEYFDY